MPGQIPREFQIQSRLQQLVNMALSLHRYDLALDQLEVLVLRDDAGVLHAQNFANREGAAVETFRRARDRAHLLCLRAPRHYSVRRISSTL